ncbi:MAG: hypothetical protein ACE5EQ_01455 [Phycisphaerae bacterium]
MAGTPGPVWAEDTHSPLTLALQDGGRANENAPMSLREETEQTDEHETNTHDYLEISDFFNIREANANVIQGEWEFELEGEWVTDSAGGDDDLTFTPNIKYGITDDMFVELEVLPLSLGDGSDQGNGDLSVQLFNQFLHETDTLPAFGAWVEMRIPTGEGSSGVDAEIHFNLTKTLVQNFRAHFEGFVETANGGRGDEEDNRRNFQWGLGPGFDYQFDEKTIAALNYLHRSSEERGRPNQNILEFGVVRELTPSQHLKFAVDLGLDGHEETPNVAAKILWSIEW